MRQIPTDPTDVEWRGVSPSYPCPICGSGSGCRVLLEMAFASCQKRPSDWLLTNGTWLHRIEPLTAGNPELESSDLYSPASTPPAGESRGGTDAHVAAESARWTPDPLG